jgi:UDP-glucose 4-epimerase
VNILVSGANSFIGQAVVPHLQGLGHEIVGLVQATPEKPVSYKTVVADLLDYSTIEQLVKELQPDMVIHLAAKTEVAFSFDNYLEVSQVNYVSTVNLAEACRKHVPNFKLFLMASTMETYGHQLVENGAFTEQTEQKPMAPYAVAKLACEKYLMYMEFAYKFPYCILRQTNTYGRKDNDFFVVEQIITQMLRNQSSIDLGVKEPYRNFLYIDDLVELYGVITENTDKATGQVFVTGPDNAITIGELTTIISEKLQWPGKVNWNVKPHRPGEIFYLNSRGDKAKEVLGWEPKVQLSEGLDKTIAVWKQNYASQTEEVRTK